MRYRNLMLPLCAALFGLASCRDTDTAAAPENELTRNLFDDDVPLNWSYKGLHLDPYYAAPRFQDSLYAATNNGTPISAGLLRYHATWLQIVRLRMSEMSKKSRLASRTPIVIGEMGDPLIKGSNKSFSSRAAQYADIIQQLDSLAALSPIASPSK